MAGIAHRRRSTPGRRGGAAEIEGLGTLDTGDAARVSDGGGRRITATVRGAEALIWEMHATLG